MPATFCVTDWHKGPLSAIKLRKDQFSVLDANLKKNDAVFFKVVFLALLLHFRVYSIEQDFLAFDAIIIQVLDHLNTKVVPTYFPKLCSNEDKTTFS